VRQYFNSEAQSGCLIIYSDYCKTTGSSQARKPCRSVYLSVEYVRTTYFYILLRRSHEQKSGTRTRLEVAVKPKSKSRSRSNHTCQSEDDQSVYIPICI
jgi:hypothetical protein